MEARAMKNDEIDEEMREAEADIDGLDIGANSLKGAEAGYIDTAEKEVEPEYRPVGSSCTPVSERARDLFSLFFGAVFVETFILTFVAEWGDRSQIATIALGSAHVRPLQCHLTSTTYSLVFQSMWVVSAGTITGHACCSALAVVCGRWLSTKISLKQSKSTYPLLCHGTHVFFSYLEWSLPLPCFWRDIHMPVAATNSGKSVILCV